MIREMNKNESYAISTIRVLAMLGIILCHFLQVNNNILAWWFNIGVQIFLSMSGFLLSRKGKPEGYIFLKQRMKKILLPLYIFIFIVILLRILYFNDINIFNILTYIFQIQG
ncbi:acyltransferase family protein, partial [Fusobacterium necrophorum]